MTRRKRPPAYLRGFSRHVCEERANRYSTIEQIRELEGTAWDDKRHTRLILRVTDLRQEPTGVIQGVVHWQRTTTTHTQRPQQTDWPRFQAWLMHAIQIPSQTAYLKLSAHDRIMIADRLLIDVWRAMQTSDRRGLEQLSQKIGEFLRDIGYDLCDGQPVIDPVTLDFIPPVKQAAGSYQRSQSFVQ